MTLIDSQLSKLKLRREQLHELSLKPFHYQQPTEIQIKQFYSSRAWLSVRKQILSRDAGVDQYELLNNHRIIPGNIVHHVIELRERWDLRLEPLNLECISAANHNTEHPDRRGNLSLKNKLDHQQTVKLELNIGTEKPTEEL